MHSSAAITEIEPAMGLGKAFGAGAIKIMERWPKAVNGFNMPRYDVSGPLRLYLLMAPSRSQTTSVTMFAAGNVEGEPMSTACMPW